ncbi:hypothetical protein [Streptomyces sp. 8L]|uniref:hypothetical protein n=1 Tax=Streptomyces sp. 8L TaxID=2877242 RepID=UPI001CD2E0E9|nr:hypothetical protein [Streptomyces sp. 8L]MCA1224067.1 hypothetical protein [Streptomyces sp. 8L]
MSTGKPDFSVSTGNVNQLLTGLSGRFDNEQAGQKSSDGTTAQRHDGTTAVPSRKPPAPEQPAPKPSKYTLLLDEEDALALDFLALDLRRRLGRPVDKSEILRTLIRLADTESFVTESLALTLDRRLTPETPVNLPTRKPSHDA